MGPPQGTDRAGRRPRPLRSATRAAVEHLLEVATALNCATVRRPVRGRHPHHRHLRAPSGSSSAPASARFQAVGQRMADSYIDTQGVQLAGPAGGVAAQRRHAGGRRPAHRQVAGRLGRPPRRPRRPAPPRRHRPRRRVPDPPLLPVDQCCAGAAARFGHRAPAPAGRLDRRRSRSEGPAGAKGGAARGAGGQRPLRRQLRRARDVDLDAEAGRITGLIGPNGAGKTTHVQRHHRAPGQASGGRIVLDGVDLTRMPPHRGPAGHRPHVPAPRGVRLADRAMENILDRRRDPRGRGPATPSTPGPSPSRCSTGSASGPSPTSGSTPCPPAWPAWSSWGRALATQPRVLPARRAGLGPRRRRVRLAWPTSSSSWPGTGWRSSWWSTTCRS